jgi:hypothetical protein
MTQAGGLDGPADQRTLRIDIHLDPIGARIRPVAIDDRLTLG